MIGHLNLSNVSVLGLYWRQGRKLGRTIYAQAGERPSDDDVLLGMMDAVHLAEHVVGCHNRALRMTEGRE